MVDFIVRCYVPVGWLSLLVAFASLFQVWTFLYFHRLLRLDNKERCKKPKYTTDMSSQLCHTSISQNWTSLELIYYYPLRIPYYFYLYVKLINSLTSISLTVYLYLYKEILALKEIRKKVPSNFFSFITFADLKLKLDKEKSNDANSRRRRFAEVEIRNGKDEIGKK